MTFEIKAIRSDRAQFWRIAKARREVVLRQTLTCVVSNGDEPISKLVS
jgi:hypothetical protein